MQSHPSHRSDRSNHPPLPALPDQTEQFVRLLTRHQGDVYRYIVSLMPGSPDADDVMQDTATLLWKKFDDYDHDRPFVPWAMRFAYFEVLKHRKRMGKSRLIFSNDLLETLAGDYEAEQPALEVRRQALESCLTKLDKTDEALIQRRYASQKTIAQLAEDENRSVHKLYYALERIRASLVKCVERTMRKEGWDVA